MSHSSDRLVVAISSRALFDLSESHHIFTEQGAQAYHQYQVEHENEVLKPGVAFALTQKLLALNSSDHRHVEVILLSRNSAETGLRVFNSINHYNLDISRAAFTRGAPTSRYVAAFGAHLFLSADADDVRRVLADGYAAATIFPGTASALDMNSHELRIAFDGDAVLFSDESERVHHQEGLDAFTAHEHANAHTPLSGGPFKNFLAALHRLQTTHSEDELPLRTALLTARAAPAHERVVRTLRDWNIRIDEAFFLGGLDKTEFLKMFGADIFFDDQLAHCEAAAPHVATAHVPHGVKNEVSPQALPQLLPQAAPQVAATAAASSAIPQAQVQVTTPQPVQQTAPQAAFQPQQPQPTPIPEIHFSATGLETPRTPFDDDPLLVPMPKESAIHHVVATHSVGASQHEMHRETTPIVDGTHPQPNVSSTTLEQQGNQEKVWLFDEHPLGVAPHEPTHQPLPIPTQALHAAAPQQTATPMPVHTPTEQQPEEAILSTEEILRRFARKMTEGTHQPAQPASSSSHTAASQSPAEEPSFTASATVLDPQHRSTTPHHSQNDVFQDMTVEEISFEPVKPTPAQSFIDPLQPHPAPADKKTPPQQKPSTPANTDSSARPSMPNPFALMKDFNE